MIKRLLVAFVLLVAGMPAAASTALPHVEGPDIPPVTEPIAVINAFTNERFECTESGRHASLAVPSGWNRVIAEVTIAVDGDPWDRLFGLAIGGVEVIRGTTPRTDMTVQRDITEYAALLPPGGTADVELYLGSYVGALLGSARLLFYAEPVAVRAPLRGALGAFTFRWLRGDGQRQGSSLTFPEVAPSKAYAEVTMSGHGTEEFWFEGGLPRTFHVLVDGVEVADLKSMPYFYALLGFGNANANTACVGPGTSTTGQTVHPVMWWTAQRGLNAAGVHTGTGEIPPYRAEIDPTLLPLLTGARTVELVQEGGASGWLVSLSFLLGG